MREYWKLIVILGLLVSNACAGYLNKGVPESAGMKHQVLFYTLNGPGYSPRSRMPWVSADSQQLYFAVGDYGHEEIWYSRKSVGSWQPGIPVKELNLKGYSNQSPCLDPTGKRIYFTSDRPVGKPYNLSGKRWRLFTAIRGKNGKWAPPYYLNHDAEKGINVSTREDGHDYAVFLSRDGKTLYFTSNRFGGIGGYDIWYSKRNNQGKWTAPVNPGRPINSENNELGGVSLTGDNQSLFFASDRHDSPNISNDSYHIFRADLADTSRGWSSASVYCLTEINSERDKYNWGVNFPNISPDGKHLYFSDKGGFMWYGDDADLFMSELSHDKWSVPANLGMAVSHIVWYQDEDYLPYVAYLDAKTHQPQDILFDSALCLAYMGSSTGHDYGWGRTVKDDWVIKRDTLFYPDRELSKLNEIVGKVKAQVDQPDFKMKLVLSVPFPHKEVKDFGDIDGKGESLDFTVYENRVKAVRWYIDSLLYRWHRAHFKNLELVGLYWMREDVKTDRELVKKTSNIIHTRGLKFEWIPYFFADYKDWKEYGFDVVEYQPNYAWLLRESRGGITNPERLTEAGKRARNSGMGMELECDERVSSNGMNFRAYMDFGLPAKDGYINNSLIGYYQSVGVFKELCYAPESSCPSGRAMYDLLYRFVKEDYPEVVSLGKKYRYLVNPEADYADPDGTKLNDYLYLPDPDTTRCVVGFRNQDPEIIYDLEKPSQVEMIFAHLIGGRVDDIAYPREMKVEVSLDGKKWKSIGTTQTHPLESAQLIPGDMLVRCAPVPARYVKIGFRRSMFRIWLDELQVYGKRGLK